jgi:hypothetical protein
VNRDEFDALAAEAVRVLAAGAADGAPGQDNVLEAAQLLDAEAREFADAVDRDAKRIPYGSAVVLEGPRGVAVVQAAEYVKTVSYWWTVVGGKPDRIVRGPDLLERLSAAAHRGARPKA